MLCDALQDEDDELFDDVREAFESYEVGAEEESSSPDIDVAPDAETTEDSAASAQDGSEDGSDSDYTESGESAVDAEVQAFLDTHMPAV